eukprot:scaffold19813_cov59-Phaeocystis_antarctica.AAC.1
MPKAVVVSPKACEAHSQASQILFFYTLNVYDRHSATRPWPCTACSGPNRSCEQEQEALSSALSRQLSCTTPYDSSASHARNASTDDARMNSPKSRSEAELHGAFVAQGQGLGLGIGLGLGSGIGLGRGQGLRARARARARLGSGKG